MEKTIAFITAISLKLAQKTEIIDSMFFKFKILMAMDDNQVRLQNCNPKILANDPVYTNPLVPEQIKQAIASRTLQGLTLTEFEDAYKSILYGISSANLVEDQTPSKDSAAEPEKPPLHKIIPLPATERLDLIPQSIDPQTAILAGQTEKYLLKICRENNLTLRELQALLEIKKTYHTNLTTLLSLQAKNWTLKEIEIFFETRAILRDADNNFSLTQIINFYENFSDLTLDADFLAESILNACQALIHCHLIYENYFPDIKLKTLMEIAHKLETIHLECVLDWLKSCAAENQSDKESQPADLNRQPPNKDGEGEEAEKENHTFIQETTGGEAS